MPVVGMAKARVLVMSVAPAYWMEVLKLVVEEELRERLLPREELLEELGERLRLKQ